MVGINDNVIIILALISRNKEFANPSLQTIVLSVAMSLPLGMYLLGIHHLRLAAAGSSSSADLGCSMIKIKKQECNLGVYIILYFYYCCAVPFVSLFVY
jgi:hypothetical protein